MSELKKVMEGAIFDCISDWRSGYKIHEDLPYIAEWITDFVLKTLEQFKYITIKEEDLAKVL